MKKLKKRMRRYYCKGCERYVKRVSDKKFYVSFCDAVGKEIRMIWKPTKKEQ